MNKPAIGVDIDGTITDFSSFLLKKSPKYMKKKYKLDLANPNGYDIDEMYDLIGYAQRNHIPNPELYSKKMVKKFWNKYYISYCLGKNCRAGITEFLSLCGRLYDIVIFTSRDRSTVKGIVGLFVRTMTRLQLKKYRIKYDRINYYKNDESKISGIKEIKPQFMIDDKPDLLKQICYDIKAVCISAPYNSDVIDDKSIFKSSSLKEIYEYISNGG